MPNTRPRSSTSATFPQQTRRRWPASAAMLLLLLLFACTLISENSRITRAVPDTVNLDSNAMDRSVSILGDIYVPGGFDVDNQEAGLNVTICGAPAESFRVFRYNENVPEGLLPGRMITYIAAVVSG